jgi:hypothetical protein
MIRSLSRGPAADEAAMTPAQTRTARKRMGTEKTDFFSRLNTYDSPTLLTIMETGNQCLCITEKFGWLLENRIFACHVMLQYNPCKRQIAPSIPFPDRKSVHDTKQIV